MKGLYILILLLITTSAISQEVFNAISSDNIETVKTIIESDISKLETTQENDMTPLMFAASKGKTEIIAYLIKKGPT